MKKLIPALFLFLLLNSCEDKTHLYCWECNSVIYNKPITDIVCYEDIMEIENYKDRMYGFYEGGCTFIECTLLPDTVK